MEKRMKNIPLDILGVFLLVLGIMSIANAITSKDPVQILFLCYIGLTVIGIGILMRNSYIIMSQVYILVMPQLAWTIDFFYQLLMNKSLWGLSDYVFVSSFPLLGTIISLQHIFTIPLAIYAVSLIGLKRRDAWKISFVQVTIVYILVSLLALSETNINCIFSPCINIHLGLPYWITWFIAIFLMTFVTSVLINTLFAKLIFKKKK